MYEDSNFTNIPRPLSAGNIVTIGLKLYLSHAKQYFLLTLRAYTWSLIPIYGWAKCLALLSLVSRLTFSKLVDENESIKSGLRFVNSRKWKFLILGFYNLLIGIGILILITLSSSILIAGSRTEDVVRILLTVILFIVLAVFVIIGLLWISTKLSLANIVLGIEENIDSAKSLSRSWELTRGNFSRILLIWFIFGITLLPVLVIFQIIIVVLQSIFSINSQQAISRYSASFGLLYILLVFINNTLISSMSLSVQGVIYYDLLARNEGLGIKLFRDET
jgi:hypothetical protein